MKRSLPAALCLVLSCVDLAPVQARRALELQLWVTGRADTLVKIMSADQKQLIIPPEIIEARSCKPSSENCDPLLVLSHRMLKPQTNYVLVCKANRGTGTERSKHFSTGELLTVSLTCPGYTSK